MGFILTFRYRQQVDRDRIRHNRHPPIQAGDRIMRIREAIIEQAVIIIHLRMLQIMRHPRGIPVIDHPAHRRIRDPLPITRPVDGRIYDGPIDAESIGFRERFQHFPLHMIAHPIGKIPIA